MSNRKRVPPALPENVVSQIWDELQSSDFSDISKEVFALCRSGRVGMTSAMLEAFCQAAMEHPHFAAPRDVVAVLNVPRCSIADAFEKVRLKARSNRK